MQRFSRCNFGDEFTCNSGECISLQKRCNGIDECDDGSDEHGCNLVDIPSSYDKLISPSSFKVPDDSYHLLTHVEIISVDMIDTTKMLIGITFKICIRKFVSHRHSSDPFEYLSDSGVRPHHNLNLNLNLIGL